MNGVGVDVIFPAGSGEITLRCKGVLHFGIACKCLRNMLGYRCSVVDGIAHIETIDRNVGVILDFHFNILQAETFAGYGGKNFAYSDVTRILYGYELYGIQIESPFVRGRDTVETDVSPVAGIKVSEHVSGSQVTFDIGHFRPFDSHGLHGGRVAHIDVERLAVTCTCYYKAH